MYARATSDANRALELNLEHRHERIRQPVARGDGLCSGVPALDQFYDR